MVRKENTQGRKEDYDDRRSGPGVKMALNERSPTVMIASSSINTSGDGGKGHIMPYVRAAAGAIVYMTFSGISIE